MSGCEAEISHTKDNGVIGAEGMLKGRTGPNILDNVIIGR